jgi:hypothetical protein
MHPPSQTARVRTVSAANQQRTLATRPQSSPRHCAVPIKPTRPDTKYRSPPPSQHCQPPSPKAAARSPTLPCTQQRIISQRCSPPHGPLGSRRIRLLVKRSLLVGFSLQEPSVKATRQQALTQFPHATHGRPADRNRLCCASHNPWRWIRTTAVPSASTTQPERRPLILDATKHMVCVRFSTNLSSSTKAARHAHTRAVHCTRVRAINFSSLSLCFGFFAQLYALAALLGLPYPADWRADALL